MERLTERTSIGDAIPRLDVKNNGHAKCMEKLAEYEDLEEQGLLLRFPCKVGDTAFQLVPKTFRHIKEIKVTKFEIRNDEFLFEINNLGIMYPCKYFGKTVFLTKPEAEKKLAKMGVNNGK